MTFAELTITKPQLEEILNAIECCQDAVGEGPLFDELESIYGRLRDYSGHTWD